MAHIEADRVADTSTTTGTGSITLANAAPTGFRTVDAVAATSDTFYYTISHQTAVEWEVGLGTYSGSHVFARTTVLASSNAGAAVNFSSGTKDVFLTKPANRDLPRLTGLTDNRLIRTDGTSGNVQSTGITVDDSNNLTGAGTFNGIDIEALPITPGGRLSLATGVAVMTSTQSAKTTIYYVPYIHRQVPIYNGTRFVLSDIGGELSQATTDTTKSPAAVTTNSNYDLFVWNDSGTYRCTRGPAWSSDTSRGTGAGTTELQQILGVYTNKVAITNGPAANRGTYVGTVRSNGSSQIDWIVGGSNTLAKLFVWNMYNRALMQATVVESTSSWSYTTNTWRRMNNNANMSIQVVRGLDEDALDATTVQAVNATATPSGGIGIDWSSGGPSTAGLWAFGAASGAFGTVTTRLVNAIGLGYHELAALELGNTGATFYGASAGNWNCGITATVRV